MQKKTYAAASIALILCVSTPAIAASTTMETTTMVATTMHEENMKETKKSAEAIAETAAEAENVIDTAIHEVTDEMDAEVTKVDMTEESATEVTSEDATITPENNEDNGGIHAINDHQLDEEGRVTVETRFPEDATFPYQITLSGGEGEVNFTIDYNGQQLLIKPGTYTVKSVRNGNNKKLTKGARLVITENTDTIYLDFNNPNASENAFSIKSFLLTNLVFLLIAVAGTVGIKKYCEYTGLIRRKDD